MINLTKLQVNDLERRSRWGLARFSEKGAKDERVVTRKRSMNFEASKRKRGGCLRIPGAP